MSNDELTKKIGAWRDIYGTLNPKSQEKYIDFKKQKIYFPFLIQNIIDAGEPEYFFNGPTINLIVERIIPRNISKRTKAIEIAKGRFLECLGVAFRDHKKSQTNRTEKVENPAADEESPMEYEEPEELDIKYAEESLEDFFGKKNE